MRPEVAAEAPLGTLGAAFERTGTPAWIMRVIQAGALDLAEGFRLDLELTSDSYQGSQQATAEHLLSGEVDLIDADWISIARLRDRGFPVSAFHPYGRIMGGLVARAERFPAGLEDLAGSRVAVVHRFDKTWLLLRAFAVEVGLPDPAGAVELIETGSKHEALTLLRAGDVDGAVLFWNLAATLAVESGFELLFDALDAVEALTGAPLPTTFFVATDERLRRHPERFQAFARAFDRAVRAMRDDESLWRRGAGHAAINGEAGPLRAAWLRRIGLDWPDRLSHRLAHCTRLLGTRLGADAPDLGSRPEAIFSPDFLAPAEADA